MFCVNVFMCFFILTLFILHMMAKGNGMIDDLIDQKIELNALR